MPVFLLSVALFLATSLFTKGNLSSLAVDTFGLHVGKHSLCKAAGGADGLGNVGFAAVIATPTWRNKIALVASAVAPSILVFGYLVSFRLVQDFWYSYILSNLSYALNASHVTPWKRAVEIAVFSLLILKIRGTISS